MPSCYPRRLRRLTSIRRLQKGLDWIKENRSINVPVGLSRYLNTNVPNPTADAEQVQGSEESSRVHMLAPFPLSKIEQWARWITESVGRYSCYYAQLKGSLQKSQWCNQAPMTFFSFQKECWSSTTPSGLAGKQADFFSPRRQKHMQL